LPFINVQYSINQLNQNMLGLRDKLTYK